MKYNLDGKIFRSISSSDNADVDAATTFHYHQNGKIVSAEYSGGVIVSGHLLGRMLGSGQLDFRYHHINSRGEIMVGTCLSTPELLTDGRLRFREVWQWLSGDLSSGNSVIEEVARQRERRRSART